MKQPHQLPARFEHRAFNVSEALEAGVSRDRLRRSDLAKPFHGIRMPAGQLADVPGPVAIAGETSRQRWARTSRLAIARARAYATRMPTDQFFTHVMAAQIHGLPLPARLARRETVDVGSTVRTRRRHGTGVAGHLVAARRARVVDVHGLRASPAVDTWCQLSTWLTLDELIAMGDALVRRQDPPSSLGELARAVRGHAGRPGARRLRDAFNLIRPGTDSPKETELRLLLVRSGLPEPEVNPELLNRFGAFMAYGDLVYRRYKVLVEYDGEQHRDDDWQFHHDIDRLDEVMEDGWRVIHVDKHHLRVNPTAIVVRVRTALIERGWTPG